ncbi:hypothetical protein M011DRAFT_460918 [Sporormia fimetaria CBS 119925]|uniref:Uncharacterized protein n=1 Tax=Sporormia fimetaria CBS 119925 TaxID=1340428 RepID=A0A6A6V3D3_9PLEO|nr:hypothetical protein M011DRAFT_460918 [Sporormia fimetaria CBS 119925]
MCLIVFISKSPKRPRLPSDLSQPLEDRTQRTLGRRIAHFIFNRAENADIRLGTPSAPPPYASITINEYPRLPTPSQSSLFELDSIIQPEDIQLAPVDSAPQETQNQVPQNSSPDDAESTDSHRSSDADQLS